MRALRVGAAFSQTGRYALQGQQARQGLCLWGEDLNARGGLHIPERRGSVPIELVLYDDQSQRTTIIPLIEQLITQDRVDVLIGPYSSGLTHAAAAVAEAHAKLLWNHGGSSDAIMRQGYRWLVNIPTPASRYFAGIFTCLAGHVARGDRVAIIQRQPSPFAAEVAAGTRHQAEHAGLCPLAAMYYPESLVDTPALVQRLVVAQPSIIVAVGRYTDDVALVRALAHQRVDVDVLAAVATPMQAFQRDLQQAAVGCIGPSQWEAESLVVPDVGPTSATFMARYRQRFGAPPDYPAAQAYAAGVVLERCVEAAGTLREEDLQQAARQLVCRTFYGRFQVDAESGEQIGHEVTLIQWQAGEKRRIWPPETAQAALMYPKPQIVG
jgi:branched-chain amino acid transport system substrate-binding protein